MSDDKIAEIRARHDAVHNVLRGASDMHDDRGYLLAEVERLRAEMLNLAEWCELWKSRYRTRNCRSDCALRWR